MTSMDQSKMYAPAAAPRRPDRIPETCDAVASYWSHPRRVDLRLGQMLLMVVEELAPYRNDPASLVGVLRNLEDDALAKILRRAEAAPGTSQGLAEAVRAVWAEQAAAEPWTGGDSS